MRARYATLAITSLLVLGSCGSAVDTRNTEHDAEFIAQVREQTDLIDGWGDDDREAIETAHTLCRRLAKADTPDDFVGWLFDTAVDAGALEDASIADEMGDFTQLSLRNYCPRLFHKARDWSEARSIFSDDDTI